MDYTKSFEKCLPWFDLGDGIKFRFERHFLALANLAEKGKLDILEKFPAPLAFCYVIFKKGRRKVSALLFYPNKGPYLENAYVWEMYDFKKEDTVSCLSWKELVKEVKKALK